MKKKRDKEFIALFDRLTGKRSKWEVWNDFLTMAAIAFANVMPTYERAEREQRYLSVICSYDIKEQEIFPRLLSVVTMALEENPKQDFLGELYISLNLNQHQKGQFFTPYHICEFMAEVQIGEELLAEVEKKGYISVNDPACGAGAMLIAFANSARKHGFNYQEKVLFVAQDIDATAAKMCYIQLTLLGCSACIIIGDTIAKPGFHPDNEIYYTPMYYLNAWRFCEKTGDKEISADEMVTETVNETSSEAVIEAAVSNPTVDVEEIREAFQEDANGQFSFGFLTAS
ncbi:N-6 DNA methylase [Enterocloster clostridioformis]|uniref:N-6 DNA methylase n=1 Tax=Enterocloster clostridioformis TaxID=1531 RepID=UPI002674C218|nr:N-6 DNA methylase [Enterocloster clostridioformis]